MSKKRILLKNEITKKKKDNLRRVLKKISLIFLMVVAASIIGAIIYGYITSKPSRQTVCIRNEAEARQRVADLPEVKKFTKKLKRDQLTPYIDVDMPLLVGNETKTGHAYVGESMENNSKTVFSSYVFVTGCGSKIQKQKKIDLAHNPGPYWPISFDYINQMAYKVYINESKFCLKDVSKLYKVDFDQDGQQEFLRGCVTGGNSNEIKYYLYKNVGGKIVLLDTLTSSGAFDEIADFNKDGYPDVATSQILMDIGGCQEDGCYVKLSDDPQSGKALLKQSFHHLWDPKQNKFGHSEKAEIYYFKNGKKTIK